MTDRPLFYLLDVQGNPYPTENAYASEALLRDIEKRRAGRTESVVAGRKVQVTTIFLPFDEQYITNGLEATGVALFQTNVFVDSVPIPDSRRYYKTREEALQGHADVCRDADFLGDDIEKGRFHWSDFGKKLEQRQGLREIARISQEAGEYD